MSSNIFEKHPKLSTLILSIIIFAFTISILVFILRLDILQDREGEKKYSIAEKSNIQFAVTIEDI